MNCLCNDGSLAQTEDGYNYCFDVLECADALSVFKHQVITYS